MAKLKLSNNKVIAGVCAGFAEFFGIDATIVRILMVIFTLCGGAGLLVYLVAWLVMYISEK